MSIDDDIPLGAQLRQEFRIEHEVPLDFIDPCTGEQFEVVVTIGRDGRAASVDAWDANGDRASLDTYQREAVVALAVQGWW